MNRPESIPHWDMSNIYAGFDAPEFTTDFEKLGKAIKAMEARFDVLHIGSEPAPADASAAAAIVDELLDTFNSVLTDVRVLSAYISAFVSTDSRNTTAMQWMSKLMMQNVALEKLEPRFNAWVGTLDLDAVCAISGTAAAHRFTLEKTQIEAQHQMSPAEEDLAADLNMTGGRAWGKLHGTFTSQITAEVEVDGEVKTLPMTAIRNLAYHEDRDTRKRAYDAELAAWKANEVPVAAAMNSIKGQMLTLSSRRGWASPREVALHNNNIDGATLDAMLDTAKTYFPVLRRYLYAKAKALNLKQLAWYDIFAPVGKFEQEWTFASAREFIIKEFNGFSPRLGAMAQRAFEENWIDAEPRDGKRGGAFCMRVRADESRIMSNFQPAYGGMSTLAHELGHAYHNVAHAIRTYLQRSTPMTLAETASTFCQVIARNAALATATPLEQLAILEADLQDSTQVVVDITSRFIFESAVFEQRNARELSADEFNELMLDAQRQTYGDGLDNAQLHPYMWAVKPHYYGSTFYNFPYMFGLLFSLGLYAAYQKEPETFLERYDDLLSSTGMADAATLAAKFGMDITKPAFWEGSLKLLEEDVVRFETLVDEVGAGA